MSSTPLALQRQAEPGPDITRWAWSWGPLITQIHELAAATAYSFSVPCVGFIGPPAPHAFEAVYQDGGSEALLSVEGGFSAVRATGLTTAPQIMFACFDQPAVVT